MNPHVRQLAVAIYLIVAGASSSLSFANDHHSDASSFRNLDNRVQSSSNNHDISNHDINNLSTSENDATDQLLQQLRQQAHELQLAHQPQWRRLLYLSDQPEKNEISRVTQSSFFNAPDGARNAEHELDATLNGLFNPVSTADQSVACRFPARRTWLANALKINPDQVFPHANCPVYQRFINEVKPDHITLIFAADFLGNPSSAFGHTLLRIDQHGKKNSALTAYAINYEAKTVNENSASFVWKGLTGGYPASFSLMPYFEKVKEYGAMESRDLWEYPLNLTPDETRFLVNHTWEMREIQFPYYFLSKNCSYELLGLLDIARPRLNLQQQFAHHVIPAQTVKAISQQTDLISEVVYRPALDTQLHDQSARYGQYLSQRAHQLANNPDVKLSDLNLAQQAQVQEMAYDDLYVRLMAREVEQPFAQPRLRQLLVARSQNPEPVQRRDLPVPRINPATGHDSGRVQLAAGQQQQHDFASVEWRLAYHDLLDPIGGYRAGTRMDFLRAKLRYQHERVNLQELELLNIDSLTPMSVFSKPSSWGIELGWQQEAIDSTGQFSERDDHGVFNLQGQYGYSMGSATSILCYAQAQAALQLGKTLQDNARLGVGPRLGCVQQITPSTRALLNISLPYWSDQHQWQLKSQLGIQQDINRHYAIRLSGDYQRQKQQHFSGLEVGLVKYF